MLSWLERGLAEPDESGEITEFLIAPFQRKGDDRGRGKGVGRSRLSRARAQETRRILYVAATRAREELHLFARPACKEEDGNFALVEPANSLLATAWPALEEEVRARFEEWKTARGAAGPPVEEEIESIAASGESNLLVMPSPIRPTLLRRLPPDYSSLRRSQAHRCRPAAESDRSSESGRDRAALQPPRRRTALPRSGHGRPHTPRRAGPAARQARMGGRPLGPAAILSPASPLRCAPLAWTSPRPRGLPPRRFSLRSRLPMIPSGRGFSRPTPARPARQAGLESSLALCARCAWTASSRLVSHPGSRGEDCWWVIDYKTAHAEQIDPAKALPALRAALCAAGGGLWPTAAQPARRGALRSSPASIIRACSCWIGGSYKQKAGSIRRDKLAPFHIA